MRDSVKAAQKLQRVIDTCKTEAHFAAAARMAMLFIRKYHHGTDYLKRIQERMKTLKTDGNF